MADEIIYEPLNRLEITLAEIMRLNYPDADSSGFWIDIVEDLGEMLGSGKPRFNSNAFYERCFGDWGKL